MTPLIGGFLLITLLIGIVWIGIRQSMADGFFISLWTVLILFLAYQFARLEWDFFIHVLTRGGMRPAPAKSMAYWIGFLIIVAPGMLAIRFLAKPKIPFPYPLEKYGSIILGLCLGVLLFACVVQWALPFNVLPESIMTPLRYFRPLFQMLGYRADFA